MSAAEALLVLIAGLGAGTINANVTNNGTLVVAALGAAGTLSINGNYTQGSGGTCRRWAYSKERRP